MAKTKQSERPETLEGVPLHYAPENEMGVVFLFSHFAKRWRLKVDQIRAQFPDCIAYQKIGGKEKPIRIEFEFRSRNFRTHGHSAKGCDWIVCWEHDWPDAPRNLKIVELRKLLGLGLNIWIQPVSGQYKETLSQTQIDDSWSVPSLSHEGDLLLKI